MIGGLGPGWGVGSTALTGTRTGSWLGWPMCGVPGRETGCAQRLEDQTLVLILHTRTLPLQWALDLAPSSSAPHGCGDKADLSHPASRIPTVTKEGSESTPTVWEQEPPPFAQAFMSCSPGASSYCTAFVH